MTAARVTPLYALLEPQQQTLVRTTLESQGGNAADLDQLDACAAGLWDRAALPLYLNLTPLDRQLLHIFNVGRPSEPDAPTLLSSVPIKGKGNGPLLFPTPVGTLTTLHLNLLGVPMPGGYLTLTSNEIMPVSTFLQAYNAGNLKVAAALHRLLGRRRPWSDLYDSMALAFGCMIKEPHTPKLAACAVHVSPPPALSVRDRETLTDLHRLIPGEDYVLSFHWDKKTVTDFQVFTVSGQPCLIFPETVVADFGIAVAMSRKVGVSLGCSWGHGPGDGRRSAAHPLPLSLHTRGRGCDRPGHNQRGTRARYASYVSPWTPCK